MENWNCSDLVCYTQIVYVSHGDYLRIRFGQANRLWEKNRLIRLSIRHRRSGNRHFGRRTIILEMNDIISIIKPLFKNNNLIPFIKIIITKITHYYNLSKNYNILPLYKKTQNITYVIGTFNIVKNCFELFGMLNITWENSYKVIVVKRANRFPWDEWPLSIGWALRISAVLLGLKIERSDHIRSRKAVKDKTKYRRFLP